MRLILAVSLAALAAAPLSAQKPGAGDDPRERYRGEAIAICVAELGTLESAGPDEVEAGCHCAADRFMPRWPTGALPVLGPGRLRSVMGSELLACAAEQDPRLAAALAQHLAKQAMAPTPAPTPAAGPPAKDPESGDFDVRAWFDSVPLGRWISESGLPLWAWAAIAALLLVLLRALFGRREGQDLLGPPRSTQPGSRPGSWPR